MTAPIEMIAVCTYNKRASTQHSRSYFLKTGESAWGRDVYHLRRVGSKDRTRCGVNCSDWLVIGQLEEVDDNCCVRCLSAKAHPCAEVINRQLAIGSYQVADAMLSARHPTQEQG